MIFLSHLSVEYLPYGLLSITLSAGLIYGKHTVSEQKKKKGNENINILPTPPFLFFLVLIVLCFVLFCFFVNWVETYSGSARIIVVFHFVYVYLPLGWEFVKTEMLSLSCHEADLLEQHVSDAPGSFRACCQAPQAQLSPWWAVGESLAALAVAWGSAAFSWASAGGSPAEWMFWCSGPLLEFGTGNAGDTQ